MYFLYILECKDGSLYTGITTNLERRFKEHQNGVGANYTRSRGVNKILYSKEYPDRGSATKRELEIKKLSREEKFDIIHQK